MTRFLNSMPKCRGVANADRLANSPGVVRLVAQVGESSMSIARILIVDDDPHFCEISRTILEPVGYEVITAADTKEAMQCIERDWPDLILLDLMFHTLDEGLQFGERLHHDPILRHLPLVFITSIADSAFADRVKPEEVHYAAAWLPKPFSPQTLIQTIGEVLEQRK